MSIFLFLKQIVDIFYQYRFLDYVMVIFAFSLLIYQLWLRRPDNKTEFIECCQKTIKNITITDICICYFIIISSLKYFLYSTVSLELYGKIMSAFLMFFIGRFCKDRIEECSGMLAISAYIVVYANLIYRYFYFGFDKFLTSKVNDGCFYYFDTDLSYAMLIGLVFIAMYARNGILKFITVFITCPFMILHSGADIQKVLLVVTYIVLFVFIGERAVKRRRISDYLLPIALLLLCVILVGIISPVFTNDNDSTLIKIINRWVTDTNNISDRYIEWQKARYVFDNSSMLWKCIGVNDSMVQVVNQYLHVFFNYGYIGMIATLLIIISSTFSAIHTPVRKTFYVSIMLAIVFLGTCIVINGMDRTQMSWFVMMYVGMVQNKGISIKENV